MTNGKSMHGKLSQLGLQRRQMVEYQIRDRGSIRRDHVFIVKIKIFTNNN